jgi:hypothetical protein
VTDARRAAARRARQATQRNRNAMDLGTLDDALTAKTEPSLIFRATSFAIKRQVERLADLWCRREDCAVRDRIVSQLRACARVLDVLAARNEPEPTWGGDRGANPAAARKARRVSGRPGDAVPQFYTEEDE